MKKGLTFVEILIVVSILMLMVGVMVGNLNPIALVNKGKDTRRKKDMTRIRMAMEEYMADEGCFPADTLLTELTSESNCKTDIFTPWLDPWPCDPGGSPYMIVIDASESCPDWFKVFVWLDNSEDSDILAGWNDYDPGEYLLSGGYSNTTVNYGTSSTNVVWYERIMP